MERQLLTPKEKEIVKLLLDNHSNASIATKLGSTPKAVSTRLCRVYIKFGISKKINPRQLLKEMATSVVPLKVLTNTKNSVSTLFEI